ncbi:Predicted Yippee-type zinc-binding protein [Phaffia rhodozyma]|uniref:Protein yippee-like n=1 Tax=Phaffia rhodozyma TaxID=264483 RepID=A0A0F7SU64_PHARH|nr:Predicted Yippee-type zinc-binding protein [Phaffia rhodozyma]
MACSSPISHTVPDDIPVYVCVNCSTKLVLTDELVSRSFSGREGPAFLVASAINITLADPEDRTLQTGRHTVRDISCKTCGTVVGWRYDRAEDASQKLV